jgi:hypothetical protein
MYHDRDKKEWLLFQKAEAVRKQKERMRKERREALENYRRGFEDGKQDGYNFAKKRHAQEFAADVLQDIKQSLGDYFAREAMKKFPDTPYAVVGRMANDVWRHMVANGSSMDSFKGISSHYMNYRDQTYEFSFTGTVNLKIPKEVLEDRR